MINKTSFFLTLCALFILAQVTDARARDNVLDIQEVTSPSGLKAWLLEDHSVPVIALKASFRHAGSATHDTIEKQGLVRLLSNMMDEGAGNLDSQSFQKELRDLSISLGFGSSRDEFSASLKTLSQNKDRAFALLNLALTWPRFDEEPLTRMKAANQSRVRNSLSSPNWIAARLLNDRAYEGHPYAMNSGGTLSTLEGITADDLRALHKKTIGQNNLVISVAGDITPQELAHRLDQIFGDLPEIDNEMELPASLDIQNQGDIYLYNKEIPQTIIEIIQPGIARTDPDYFNSQIMNFILGSSGFGSRLMQVIREDKGLTYGIYSRQMNLEHVKTLGVSTSTKNENVPEMLALIREEWDRMKNTDITAEELKNAQSYLINALPLSLTSTSSIASLMLDLQLDNLPLDYLDRRKEAFEKATIDDIARVAKRILDTEKMITILVGNPQNIKNVIEIEHIPNVE